MTASRNHRETQVEDDSRLNSASYESLLTKYKALCQKYTGLVEKLEHRSQERAGALELASWAMRSLSSAVALVRGQALLMANTRWYDLAGPLDEPAQWRAVSGGALPERVYQSLQDLVSAEAASLNEARSSVVQMFEPVGTEQIIEVRLELIARPEIAPVVVAIAQDVTARTRSERELEKAREALSHHGRMRTTGELASGVAHDLNNVLGALVLRVSLLEADARCMEAQGKNIDAISRILKDATARVARLHELSRRPREIPLQTIDIGATILEAVEMARAEVEDKASFAGAPIRILTSVEDLPNVPALSAADVRHMFINLLLNARDAMKAKGGMIQIEGTCPPGSVVVTVTDEGTGIPEEHLDKVFDPFFTTKGDRGTGLGLANAYEVMSTLRGKIEAANRPSGGAVITLTFPISVERLAPKMPGLLKAAPGQRVLLIDDDPDQLMMAKAVLELDEQEVDVASGGEEALALLRSGGSYDLVLCDAGMPDMNGLQVAEEIQKLAPGTKVYLLTGWSPEIAEDDPRHACVSGVLPKPMNLDRLRAILAPRSRE